MNQQKAIQGQAILDTMGMNDLDAILKREVITGKDTIFFNPGDTISANYAMFDDTPKPDPYYKNMKFPNNSNSYLITHLMVRHNLLLDTTGTNAALQNEYLAAFEQNSVFEFRNESNLIGKPVYLSDLVAHEWTPRSTTTTAASSVVDKMDKHIGFWWKLDVPMVAPAGKKLAVTFMPVPGFSVSAYVAAATPFIPSGTAVLLSSCTTRGHYLQLLMKCQKYTLATN